MCRAPAFQLLMMPLRSLLIIASSEDAMIAARKFSAASDKTLCFPRSPADSSALTNAYLLRSLFSKLRLCSQMRFHARWVFGKSFWGNFYALHFPHNLKRTHADFAYGGSNLL